MKKLETSKAERRKRALVQVRREEMLKKRRSAQEMFRAHCAASQAPKRPSLGMLEEVRRQQQEEKTAAAQLQEHLSHEAAPKKWNEPTQLRFNEEHDEDGLFLTELDSTSAGYPRAASRATQSSDADSVGEWPTLPTFNAYTAPRLRPDDHEISSEASSRDFAPSLKAAAAPSFPKDRTTYLPAPPRKQQPSSVAQHLMIARGLNLRRPTSESTRPLPSKIPTPEVRCFSPTRMADNVPSLVASRPQSARSSALSRRSTPRLKDSRPSSARVAR